MKIAIKKEPEFKEVWYEGHVIFEDTLYQFWLVDPQSVDPNSNQYEPEVKWFFKNIPREVRMAANEIVKHYLERQND
jgi:hypothetical protein